MRLQSEGEPDEVAVLACLYQFEVGFGGFGGVSDDADATLM
jgi:hypothetical protein